MRIRDKRITVTNIDTGKKDTYQMGLLPFSREVPIGYYTLRYHFGGEKPRHTRYLFDNLLIEVVDL